MCKASFNSNEIVNTHKIKLFQQHTSLNLERPAIGGNKNLSTTITAIDVDGHLNS